MAYPFPDLFFFLLVLLSNRPCHLLSKLCRFMNLPYPKEETLARHSILGPNGLNGRFNGPVTGIKV